MGIRKPGWMAVSPFASGLLVAPRHGLEHVQLLVLGVMVLTSAFVLVDIAYNVMSIATIGLFAVLGLRIDRGNIPLILFLFVFNIAGLIALQPHLDFAESREFMLGTCFVAVTAVFFAALLNENGLQRLEVMKWGLILGALAASGAGLLGYIGIPGFDGRFTMHGGRISGTFRDPNVFGSFLVLPVLYLASDIMRTKNLRLIRLGILLPIILALFLTFSRGSWAAFVIGMMVLVAVMFVTAAHAGMRARITLLTMLGAVGFLLLMAALLSVSGIAEVFADRFTLAKDYDSGPSGRFGNQLRALPELLAMPFGYGPNRFWLYYPENPHNTYVTAFASYGWLGGLTFIAFIGSTLLIACRTVLLRTPFQAHAIVLLAALVPHLVQNFQIDTDRWRHLFMIYGLTWGIAAISNRWLGEYRAYAHGAYSRQAALGAAPQPAE